MGPIQQFIEQLGAPSSPKGLQRASDVLQRALPGFGAKYRISGDHDFRDLATFKPFIEQLGIASDQPPNARFVVDLLTRGLAGLSAKHRIAKENGGVDYRALLREFAEREVNQWPLEVSQKAWVMTTLYTIAARLPGR